MALGGRKGLLGDPVGWADKAVGTYPRFLFVMLTHAVMAMVALVGVAFENGLALAGPIFAFSTVLYVVALRMLLLHLRRVEAGEGSR